MKTPTPSRAEKCPAELTGEARREWKRLVGSINGFDQADRPVLAGYCVAWECFEIASRNLHTTGLLVGGMVSPWLRARDAAIVSLLKFTRRLKRRRKS